MALPLYFGESGYFAEGPFEAQFNLLLRVLRIQLLHYERQRQEGAEVPGEFMFERAPGAWDKAFQVSS